MRSEKAMTAVEVSKVMVVWMRLEARIGCIDEVKD
jgi:hypothetical protein